MIVLAIDPGPTESAWLIYDSDGHIGERAKQNNEDVLRIVRFHAARLMEAAGPSHLIVEQVQSFGMSVGASVFETVFWSGRFCEAWGHEFNRLGRIAIKNHLCHSSRAKDSNIRQALIDRFGEPGTKKQPGLTHGISKDLWSALAVAVTYCDKCVPEPDIKF